MLILLNWWILPIGGASAGKGLRLQPVQQACLGEKSIYLRPTHLNFIADGGLEIIIIQLGRKLPAGRLSDFSSW